MKRRDFITNSSMAISAMFFPSWKGYSAESEIPTDLLAITGDGENFTLKKADIANLRKSLKGTLLLKDDNGYDVARLVRNRVIDRNPALIAQCVDETDIQKAINFAREFNLLTAVKCGGHSVSGKGTCDQGIIIDLSPFRRNRLDIENRRLFITGGSWLGDLDDATIPYGLGTTAGTVSHTGVGGLATGGGFGRLGRKYGLTLDNIKSIQIVTADGQLRYADENENADLFWGVRGGGGNFGIVTMFEFQLHPMNKHVVGGRITFDFSQVKQLLKFHAEHSLEASVDMYQDPVVFAPPMGYGNTVYFDVCYSGPLEMADKAFEPLRKAGKIIQDDIDIIDYAVLQKSGDDNDPRGRSQYLKGGFTINITDGLIDAIVDNLESHPERGSMAFFQQAGGKINTVAPDATAFPHRYPEHNLITGSFWKKGVDTAPHIAWSRSYWKQVSPYTDGFYINDEFSESQKDVNLNFLGNYERLVQIKNKYDPTNLFRLNANIKPTV
ncbi:MAG: FAD-binding protein, partial [Porticoccaceae bacterium]|nr:FAD-binding protein [Porticoccaceae bacterium]|tara:strand:+ start:184 stop:1674 length:1491 start_codon:yes stop_codon:yes gene_type:complete